MINTKIPKPLFIVFEGIDGSGKTTVSQMLFNHLSANGWPIAWFREPSDSTWGRKIRELASHKETIPIEEELEYFLKDREWDVEHNILPNLKQNKSVILDRYYLSTAAYQGARGFDMTDIIEQNTQFAPVPHITFIIDVDVDTALDRIKRNREQEVKLFEKREFLQKVRENYLKLQGPGIYIIDGSRPLDQVFQEVLATFDKVL